MGEILPFIAALVVGFTLGLLGGGGSILTVPVLVYLAGIPPFLATSYSLFVVGTAALIGSFSFMKREMVSYKTAIVFAIPSMAAVFAARKWIVPAIPESMTVMEISFGRNLLLMVLFAMVMIAASYNMIKKKKGPVHWQSNEIKYDYKNILWQGALIGLVTGTVGAGGGFLIVPALVLLANLPIKLAVGTSLLVISINSLFGFSGSIGQADMDWTFLLIFTGITFVGILIGGHFNSLVSPVKLKRGFGWFVLVMGILIFTREVLG